MWGIARTLHTLLANRKTLIPLFLLRFDHTRLKIDADAAHRIVQINLRTLTLSRLQRSIHRYVQILLLNAFQGRLLTQRGQAGSARPS